MSLEALGPHQGDADALARRLARALLGGDWQPGDVFPKELDIAARCAVSRNLVRNALASLTAAGLLERTAGRGTRVREVGDWHLLDPQMSDWLVGLAHPQPQLVRELLAFRYSAEPVVAELAARAAGPDDLARLEAAFRGMAATADASEQAGQHVEYDVAFHEAIYEASHNLIWRQMGHLLRPSILALVQHSQRPARGDDGLGDSLERHGAVLEAIKGGDGPRAARAAREVLGRTARDLGVDTETGARAD
ncbi:FadR/GntR family transcriptional regulator [Halomonas getboli]|uniref:FadR/GntR family transcriptional regulator n=1 Tax=Halomonas getboli TaxID=2935862 RepID=UPI001FFE657F|nr:FCD domain-containing protein [Halomonas getboli]MCK2184502.1 FCD domain-containing protein [Halomonas getboli]